MAERKPIVVDGVPYEPKWDWSPEYRKDFQRHMRAVARGTMVPDKEHIKQYIEWYAEQNGLSKKAAEKALRKQGKIA